VPAAKERLVTGLQLSGTVGRMGANKNWGKSSQKLSNNIQIPLCPKEFKCHSCFVILKFLHRVMLSFREWLKFQTLQA